ncbi:MAG: hypothetical protein ACRD2J_06925 [Thermoanaerobaculia bacterium]
MGAVEIGNPRWDPRTWSLLLDVDTLEERLTCRIGIDALRKLRSAADPSLAAADLARAIFEERRDDINDVVRRLVWDRRISSTGEIRIIADALPLGW